MKQRAPLDWSVESGPSHIRKYLYHVCTSHSKEGSQIDGVWSKFPRSFAADRLWGFIFSGGQRGRSLYLQKNIAKLGGRVAPPHKHYLWLADKLPAARAEKAPPYGAALN